MHVCLSVCVVSELEYLHACVTEFNCEDELKPKLERFITTADYICSDEIKPGLYTKYISPDTSHANGLI